MAEAIVLDRLPNKQEVCGIIASNNAAWVANGISRYPYHKFRQPAEWEATGELGRQILEGVLHVGIVIDGDLGVVGHAALSRNGKGEASLADKGRAAELGRIFSRIAGRGYGIRAVEAMRQYAEQVGINQVFMGVSYNRTAMFHAFERTFSQHGWKLAVLGLLPDIYNEADMQWGEIITIGVKDRDVALPPLPDHMPGRIKRFAQGMQQKNSHCVVFNQTEEQPQQETAAPYTFSENTVGVEWHDIQHQQQYLKGGYRPTGLIPMNGAWYIVLNKGALPPRIRGRAEELVEGRSPVIYPPKIDGRRLGPAMRRVYRAQR